MGAGAGVCSVMLQMPFATGSTLWCALVIAPIPVRVAGLVAAAVIRTDATLAALGGTAAAACRAISSNGAVCVSSVGVQVAVWLGLSNVADGV